MLVRHHQHDVRGARHGVSLAQEASIARRDASGSQYAPGMPLPNLLRFSVAAFVIIVVPGPSVLFIVSRGVALGRRAALATVVGNTAGELLLAGLVAVGVGGIIATSDLVFTLVKIVGACYLVWL